MDLTALNGQIQVEFEGFPVHSVAIDVVLESIGAVGDGFYTTAHLLLGALLQLGDSCKDGVFAVAVEKLP